MRVDATLLAVESQHMHWDQVLRGRDSPVSVHDHRQLSLSALAGRGMHSFQIWND